MLLLFAVSGVSTDIWTSYAARMLIISVVPIIIVQLSQYFLTEASTSRLAILISLIISISFVIYYCLYQVVKLEFVNKPSRLNFWVLNYEFSSGNKPC